MAGGFGAVRFPKLAKVSAPRRSAGCVCAPERLAFVVTLRPGSHFQPPLLRSLARPPEVECEGQRAVQDARQSA